MLARACQRERQNGKFGYAAPEGQRVRRVALRRSFPGLPPREPQRAILAYTSDTLSIVELDAARLPAQTSSYPRVGRTRIVAFAAGSQKLHTWRGSLTDMCQSLVEHWEILKCPELNHNCVVGLRGYDRILFKYVPLEGQANAIRPAGYNPHLRISHAVCR